MLRQAVAKHGRGDLEGAQALYRKALRAHPNLPDAHNLLGVVARQRGDIATALRETERAVQLAPEEPVYLANRGAALAEAGQLPAAVAMLRAALRRRPQDPIGLRNLGQALCALGQPQDALLPLQQATALAPDQPEPWLALAHAWREAGDPAQAATAAQRALAQASANPGMAEQARFLLAALGAAAAPDRAPAHYVRDLFDQYAPRFEQELTGRLEYRTPELLAALLGQAGLAPAGQLVVLDLGCGTGLSGQVLAPFARRLEGLDLSPRMLAEARRRQGLYAALHEADLLDFLPRHAGAYDLIAAVDVLNYLGELGPALAAMAAALRPGGHAAFSIEAGEQAPFTLGEGLRYRHAPAHVAALAAAAGLQEAARQPAVLRQDRGQPVQGVLFVLRKPAAG